MANLMWTLLLCVTSCAATQLAREQCDATRMTVTINTNAKFVIGGLFEIREAGNDGYGCGQPAPDMMQMYEAARWTIDRLNSRNFIPGIPIGMKVYDTCYSPEQSLRAAYDFYPQSSSRLTYCGIKTTPTQISAGFLGAFSSRTSISVAGLIKHFPAPAVSPRSPDSSLSNKDLYPSFMRTGPSAATLARAISAMLERLGWTKIVMVYSDDQYGRDGLQQMLRFAMNSGKCIIQAVALKKGETRQQYGRRLSAISRYDVKGALFWAQSAVVNEALGAMEDMLSSLGGVQWIFTDLDITQTYTQAVARGALTVRSTSTVIDSFRNHWVDLNPESPPTDNPWFQDWYMTTNNCRFSTVNYPPYNNLPLCRTVDRATRIQDFVQSPYVETTIKAVFAFAVALKDAHTQQCQGVSGLCDNLRVLGSDTWINKMQHSSYTFVPGDDLGGLTGQTQSFDSHGDSGTSSFTVWNYDNNKFNAVGTYTNNNLDLVVTSVAFYNAQRSTRLTSVPPSPCPPVGCQNCLLPVTDVSYTYVPGDLLIGGMFSIHDSGSDPLGCGQTNVLGAEAMMALKYAVTNYRNHLGNDILKGVDLGILVADSCNQYVAEAFLDDLLSGKRVFKTKSGKTIDTEYLTSFINSNPSSIAMETSKILGHFMMPEIETLATASGLGNREMYPYFNRAIPADNVFSSAIMHVLRRLKWTFVQVLYRGNLFGHDQLISFKAEAVKAQICIAGAHDFEMGFEDVVDKLRENTQARGVIVLGSVSDIRGLFAAVRAKNAAGEFVFIGNDVWGDRLDVVRGFEDVADGSLTVTLSKPDTSGFNTYLAGFNSLEKIRLDPILAKLYERRYECYLNAGDRGRYTKNCQFSAVQQSTPYSPYVIPAFYAMAIALDTTLQSVCGINYSGVCTAFRHNKNVSRILLDNIRNIEVKVSAVTDFKLVNGEGTADIRIYNYRSGTGPGSYVGVGSFSTTAQTITDFVDNIILTWNRAAVSTVTSRCTSSCLQCYAYQQQPFLYIPGDIIIGGMYSVSNPGSQGPYICGTAKTTQGFQYTAAMQFAINMVNSRKAPVKLNGIRLGGLALDHCHNTNRPLSLLSSIYSGLMDQALQMPGRTASMYRSYLGKNVAAWMIDTSSSTQEAASLLQPLNIPIVSPSATATSLMNISTFYRTIQGDDAVAMAIVKTVKSLKFPYVQVVHAGDVYGLSGLSAVVAAGQQEGICVISTTDMSKMSPDAAIRQLISSPSQVVILFLGTSDMRTILQAKAASNDSLAASLLFVSPEPYTVLVKSIGPSPVQTGSKSVTTNMLSIQLQVPILADFNKYISEKVSSGYHDNPYFAKYYMAVYSCNLPGYYTYSKPCPTPLLAGAYNPSNFDLATINAVYAVTFAIDAALKDICGVDYDSFCPKFSFANMHTALLGKLRLTSFVNNGNSFRFLNRQGNIAYDILRFDGDQMQYRKIGSYQGAALQLNAGQADDYKYVVSTCVDKCATCGQRGLNFSYVPGDVLLGGIFDVHAKTLKPFSCGGINLLHGFQLLEAFHFALGRVNSKEGIFSDILKGTTLGGLGLDSCESAIRTGYLVSNIHSKLTDLNKNGNHIDPDDIDIYIGSYSSDSSLYLARILSDLKIPQISYASTSTALKDPLRYPYFYRTVPSDDNQVRAMLSFLDVHDIRYVQVLYTKSNYGQFGAAAFERLAAGMRVCVGQMVRFPDNGTVSSESSNNVVSQLLSNPVANTIVVFAGTRYINALLRAVQRNSDAIGKFRFIGSETWATNEDAILGVEDIARGSVTFNLKTENLKVFEQHLSGMTPANSQDNPWFDEYYEKIQNCYLTVPSREYPTQCQQKPQYIITSIRYNQDPGVLHVINSVYSAAFAIDKTLIELCGSNYTMVCEAYKNNPNTKDLILKHLATVTFKDDSGDDFSFTDTREAKKGYDINSLLFIPNKGYVYQNIGNYSKDGKIDASSFTPDWDGSCTRQDACSECPTIRNDIIRYAIDEPANVPADQKANVLTVVGVFDVHEQGTDSYRCGKLRPEGYREFLAFFYAMQRTSYASTMKIRTVAIDTCSNSLRVGQDIYNLLNGLGLCNSNFITKPGNINSRNIGGFIVAGNTNTREASRVLDPFKVTYISPSATSNVFSNTAQYPHLARTTAPQSYLLEAIANILKQMQWDSVIAVRSSWRFEEGGYDQFVSASTGKTCVRSMFSLPVNPSPEDAKEAVRQLMTVDGSAVVLLFTNKADTVRILQAAKDLDILDKFFWVFTHPDGYNVPNWGLPSGWYFNGLVMKALSYKSKGYLEYANMTYSEFNTNNRSIPRSWYEEYFQRYFRCQLPTALVKLTEYSSTCKTSATFRDSEDTYTMSTIAATVALVNGLSDYSSKHCDAGSPQVCLQTTANARKLIFNSVLNISVTDLQTQLDIDKSLQLFFNSERFWDQEYVAWELEYDSRNRPGPGVFDSKDKILKPFSMESLKKIVSTCPTDVNCGCETAEAVTSEPLVQATVLPELRNYLRYGNDGTLIYTWPLWAIVVAVPTCVGLLVAIFATLILLFTYPIRGGTTILGFMTLIGIIGIYSINFAFFLPASVATCGARRFCMGVIYTIVFAALLVKAVDNWRFGDVEWDQQKKYRRLTSACSLFMIAIGIVFIQALIPIQRLILVPPTVSQGLVDATMHDYWRCHPVDLDTYDIGLVLSFVFVVFIVLLTAIFSALGWDSEVNNRESRWILISSICTTGCFLVWMVVTTNAGHPYRDAAVAIGNLANATALLICIPLRKMALLFKYKRGKGISEQGDDRDIIRYDANSGYANNAYDDNLDFQTMDSKPASDNGL